MNKQEITNGHATASSEPETLNVSAVAKSLGVSRATVLRWIQARKLEGFFQIGKKWLIQKADLDTFINNKKIGNEQ